MRFKSGKLSFNTLAVKVPFLGIAFGIPSIAFATLTLAPVKPYAFPDDDGDLVLEQVLRYSADSDTSSVLMDTAQSYVNLDLTEGFGTSEDSTQQVHLSLTSTTTYTDASTSRLLVSVFATVSSSTTPVAIPIASVNGVACSDSNCQGEVSSSGITYYTAARVPDESTISALDIGFYPKDICIGVIAQNAAATVSGCTGSTINSPSSSVTTAFALTVAVDVVSSDEDGIVYANADEKAAEVSLVLHAKAPSFTCPAAEDLYFPGDASILLSTDFTVVGDSANAPVDKLIAIATRGTLATDSTFATGNEVIQRFDLGEGQQLFNGLENSTVESPQKYKVRFAVLDRTGRLSTFGADSSCDLDEVEASEVAGFLSSNDCFIASAAFRSSESPWVELFREFRDEVLRPLPRGQQLIEFYYTHSPQWARYVYEYPLLRIPALMVLLPLTSVAVLFLYPGAVLAVLVGLGVGLQWSSSRRRIA